MRVSSLRIIEKAEIRGGLLKRLLSFPEIYQIYSSTALSPQQTIATWIIYKLGIFENTNHGYVGSIGIEVWIPPELRPYINESKDLDIAAEDVKSIPKEYRIIEERLIDKMRDTHRGIEIVYSPFSLFKINIPTFQIGEIKYDTIDVFTPKTGIGPIPLEKEDFKEIRYIGYLPVLSLSVLIPTHINPAAVTYERLKRALLASIYNDIKEDEIQQKLEKSMKVMENHGKISQYRKGFKATSRECYRVEKKLKN